MDLYCTYSMCTQRARILLQVGLQRLFLQGLPVSPTSLTPEHKIQSLKLAAIYWN